MMLAALGTVKAIHTLENTLGIALFEAGLGVVLVHEGDIQENILLVVHHAPQTVLENHSDLMGKGGVVANAVRYHRSLYMTVPIFVLQTLAMKCGAPRRTAQNKATGLHVASCPGQIAKALETKHQAINKEGDQKDVVTRIRRGRGNPKAKHPKPVETPWKGWPFFVLAVLHTLP